MRSSRIAVSDNDRIKKVLTLDQFSEPQIDRLIDAAIIRETLGIGLGKEALQLERQRWWQWVRENRVQVAYDSSRGCYLLKRRKE